MNAFEKPKAVAQPMAHSSERAVAPDAAFEPDEPNLVIVPAQKEGFERVFMGENMWYAIRIAGGMLPKIKYIAAYRTQPISAITHVAPVALIEPYGESGKYKLIFSEPAKEIGPIPYGDAPSGAMQGTRYSTYDKLLKAKTLTDIF